MKRKNHQKCIKKVKKSIMNTNGRLTGIKFHHSKIVWHGDLEAGLRTGQPVTIFYNQMKKDGTVVNKEEKTFVTHDFCPFCGGKY